MQIKQKFCKDMQPKGRISNKIQVVIQIIFPEEIAAYWGQKTDDKGAVIHCDWEFKY